MDIDVPSLCWFPFNLNSNFHPSIFKRAWASKNDCRILVSFLKHLVKYNWSHVNSKTARCWWCIGSFAISHRHHILTISVTGISVDIPAQFQGFTTALCDWCPTSALISAIITAKPQAVICRGWVFPCFLELTGESIKEPCLRRSCVPLSICWLGFKSVNVGHRELLGFVWGWPITHNELWFFKQISRSWRQLGLGQFWLSEEIELYK